MRPHMTGLHHRKLERMYLGAPCNASFHPTLRVDDGEARLTIPVGRHLFHAAGQVHGSVFFKALDDAAYFAAASIEHETFVLTSHFDLHLLRPVDRGTIHAHGRVVHASKARILADAVATDDMGREIARGTGTFARGRQRLDPALGYE